MATQPQDAVQPASWMSIKEPLRMLRKKRWTCATFILLNLVAGLMGVHVALLMPIFSETFLFEQQLVAKLSGGELYTFTIALLTSTLVLLLQAYSQRTIERVRDWKSAAILIAVILIILAAVGAGMQAFLAASSLQPRSSAYVFQCIIWALGSVAATYCFLLAIYEQDLDDFAASESARLEELESKSRSTSNDGRGMNI